MEQRKKIINVIIILSSFIGYLEWGTNRHAYIFQVLFELFTKNIADTSSFLHPLILIPLAGLVMLLITIFQKKPKRVLSLIGLASLSTIMLLLLFIGIIDLNPKIIISTLPFVIAGVASLRLNWKR